MKTYHIVYFESENSYHSRGVNIEAESMSRACEIFTSRYGFEPYYCAVKNP